MKAMLQEKIDVGEIDSMEQLLAYVTNRDWKVTRNGVNYMGIEDTRGRRFRVKFSFANDTRPVRIKTSRELKGRSHKKIKRGDLLPGYWIYGLFADGGEERACYIGQAVDYLCRAKQHLRGREGRSSWDLFRWAESRKASIQFVVLDFVPGQPHTPELAAKATVLEGLWLHRARTANYLTPGSERWGALPRPGLTENLQWPADEVADASRPLSMVIGNKLLPAEIAIHSARTRYEVLIAQ